jgi:DNA-binding MarR family transcriptional regulator
MKDVSTFLERVSNKSANPAYPRRMPASGQSLSGMIHSISSAHNAGTACISPLPIAFGRAYKRILIEVGLTYTQYIAMVALSEQDDQTVGALGERLFLESNTLTPILKKLEQTGYVRRMRDAADERQVRVNLTAAGHRLLEKDLGEALIEACGLGDEFPVVQKTVVRLRDNLLRNTTRPQET